MALLIEGTDGLIQAGPTSALTTIGYVKKWKVACKTDINTKGPYVGDATLRKTRKAKTSSGSLEFDVPQGADAGHTKVIALHEAATNIRLSLRGGGATGSATAGYTYVAANAIISGVDLDGDAENGYSGTFSFEDGDGYTLTPT
jgi:hypothetical protein